MKMDCNDEEKGSNKYALLNLRKFNKDTSPELKQALNLLNEAGIIEWGEVGFSDEFFVMKLRDINSFNGLVGYAAKAEETDNEWANEVRALLPRAGINSPFCKIPD